MHAARGDVRASIWHRNSSGSPETLQVGQDIVLHAVCLMSTAVVMAPWYSCALADMRRSVILPRHE